MKYLLLSLLGVLLLASPVSAQDACSVGAQPFTVSSGAPFTVAWVMDATIPVSATDPTPVPQRVDGYYIQIDNGARQEVPAQPGSPCPIGTAQAGKIPYQARTLSGVTKGNHTATVTAWNLAVDALGNPTTTRQEGPAVSTPFVGVDPVHAGPPSAPKNVIIRR